MDKIIRYREIIQEILEEYSAYQPSYGEVEVELIADSARDHYQLMTVGWDGMQRIHGCLLHIDIKGGKIWIQHDGTEEGIAHRLLKSGIPREEIILAFHAPYKRPMTGFAVA